MLIGFDVISDLNLSAGTELDWDGRATSLYCIVAGNVSNDIQTVGNALSELGRHYQGVFYIPGTLEYQTADSIDNRTKEIIRNFRKIRNVAVLHQHVVIIDGIAVVGCNGWHYNATFNNSEVDDNCKHHRYEDLAYLKNSLEKLQKHLDVTKIILVSNAVPLIDLYFGQIPVEAETQIPLEFAMMADTQKKVTHWIYGSNEKIVDTVIHNINYINNSCYTRNPYWAKRIDVPIN